jgi:HlyD family secretion protein
MIQDTSATDIAVEPKRNMLKYALIAAALITFIILGVSAFSRTSVANMSVDRASVQIATLERGDLISDVLSTGRIVAASAPQIYSPEQGIVTLKVNAGDSISVGQVIAVVESPSLQNQLQQEKSELARLTGELARQKLDARRENLQLNKLIDLAQVDLQAAQREERRAQASIVNNLISQIDHEKAVDDLARAELTYKHAQQEAAIAKDTLAFELESVASTVQRQALVVDDLIRQTQELDVLATVSGVVGNLLTTEQSFVEKINH